MKVEIKLTEEQIKQILSKKESEVVEEKKDSGRFYPKEGEEYFLFRHCYGGFINCAHFSPMIDYDDIFLSNCFRTKEEAEVKGEKNIERIKAINRVNQYIDKNGLRADASDDYVYNIEKDRRSSKMLLWETGYQKLTMLGDIKYTEEAQKILEDCEEDLKLIFNS